MGERRTVQATEGWQAMGRALVVWMLAALVGCGPAGDGPVGRGDPAGKEAAATSPVAQSGWRQLPDAPLAARHGATGVWVDGSFVVVGGHRSLACPPHASCLPPEEPPLRDGARFDPSTGEWTAIADAPVPVAPSQAVVVDGVVYLGVPTLKWGDEQRVDPAFLAYRPSVDAWEMLPLPDGGDFGWRLVAAGDSVVAVSSIREAGQNDVRYDPGDKRWDDLPADPLAPSFDRSMVAVDGHLVLLALDVDNSGARQPSLYKAAVLDLTSMTWRKLPDSQILGGYPHWFAVDDRVINPAIGGADGGQVTNYGRTYPYGGVLELGSGRWSVLPDAPDDPGPFRAPAAGDHQLLVGGQGWAFEPAAATWTAMSAPDDAAAGGQAVAVGDGRYYLWGGARWASDADSQIVDSRLVADGWVWTPDRSTPAETATTNR